jgi:hypothetical protein
MEITLVPIEFHRPVIFPGRRLNQPEESGWRKRPVTRQSNAERREGVGDGARKGPDRPHRAAFSSAFHPKGIQRRRAGHAAAQDVWHVCGGRQQVVEKPVGEGIPGVVITNFFKEHAPQALRTPP